MTDYMEAILQEQEKQGDRRAETDWRKVWEEDTLPVPETEEAGSERSAGREVPEGMPMVDPVSGAVGVSVPKTGERPNETAEGTEGSLWGNVDVESRAALPGEWIYKTLRQSLTELPPLRRESRVVTLQKPGEKIRPDGWDAAGLDRLVRRDARRFDGGFQLL